MKKLLMAAMAAAAATVFGAANDSLLTFSTKGPDKYVDGTTVLDGECYAVVWTPNGETFGGFAADGKLISEKDKLVVAAGLAKGGRCPLTVLEIDAEIAKEYEGGTFALCLLDTRVKVDGVTKVGGAGEAAQTAPAAVNAVTEIATSATADGSIKAGAASMAGKVAAYTKLGNPQIKGFAVEDATVTLTVSGLEPTATYYVLPAETPNGFDVKKGVFAKPQGDKLTIEKKDGMNFFKVYGQRTF